MRELDVSCIEAGVLLVGFMAPEGVRGEVELKMGVVLGVVAVCGPFAGPGSRDGPAVA